MGVVVVVVDAESNSGQKGSTGWLIQDILRLLREKLLKLFRTVYF